MTAVISFPPPPIIPDICLQFYTGFRLLILKFPYSLEETRSNLFLDIAYSIITAP